MKLKSIARFARIVVNMGICYEMCLVSSLNVMFYLTLSKILNDVYLTCAVVLN